MGSTPLTLRCPKCYRWPRDRYENPNIEKTGREKIRATYGYRHNVKLVECVCRDCKHIFWTSHPSMTDNRRCVGNSGHRGWVHR